MFQNILVGVDQLTRGRDAIALARVLAAPGARITLGHVHAGDDHPWRGSSPPFELAAREDSRELLRAVRSEADLDARLRVIEAASVGRGLHLLAEHVDADLLVVGSTRRGLLGRVLLGDDTQAALNGAPCAVAVAPAGYGTHPAVMREIGVGYDGSAESRYALEFARTLAASRGAKLSAFEAISLPAYLFLGPAAPPDEPLEEVVEAARERIAALGGVEPHAAYGSAPEELALYSASLDLLVTGSRDYGPVGRMLHGSTTARLARTARCPLLVLTRAARASSQTEDADAQADTAATTLTGA